MDAIIRVHQDVVDVQCIVLVLVMAIVKLVVVALVEAFQFNKLYSS